MSKNTVFNIVKHNCMAKRPTSAWRYERIVLGRIDFKILASAFSAASGVSSNCARTIAPSTAKAMACVSSLRFVDAGNRLAMTVVISCLWRCPILRVPLRSPTAVDEGAAAKAPVAELTNVPPRPRAFARRSLPTVFWNCSFKKRAAYGRRATGEKYLIAPNRGCV